MMKEANLAATENWGAEVASAGRYDVLDEILALEFLDIDPAPATAASSKESNPLSEALRSWHFSSQISRTVAVLNVGD